MAPVHPQTSPLPGGYNSRPSLRWESHVRVLSASLLGTAWRRPGPQEHQATV